MKINSIFSLFYLTLAPCCYGFQVLNSAFSITNKVNSGINKESVSNSATALNLFSFNKKEEIIAEVIPDEDESWTDFGKSPLSFAYAGSWALLVSFAFIFAPGEINSASDSAMLASIIKNPAAPDMNIFYYGIFNLFAIIPIVLGCTIAPRASKKGIPAGPPIFLSTFIAYFVMGPYLALRKEPLEVISDPTEELGWVTRNIWENKIFNYSTVAFGLLCLSAGASGLDDPAANWNGMIELLQTSRFASVSFADLSFITLLLTKEVADDYKVRCAPENVEKAALIGASTALLPILGTAIYCAVRPSFENES